VTSPHAALAARLGYAFRQPERLVQALTHRSFGAEHNERLEFVGDAVLNCVIAATLFDRLPGVPEGDLSRLRAHLVNRDTLARLARGLELGALIRFGEGERKGGGRERGSTAADALEAVFGAVFVDGGFEAARDAIHAVFADDLARLDPAILGKDPKTRLQELLQSRHIALPKYGVVATQGAAHDQRFEVECLIPELSVRTLGTGASRRAAEQEAARQAFEVIGAERPA